MNKKLDFKTFKEVAFQDEKFRTEYEALRPEFELIEKFIRARKKAHYSQEELAKRLKMQQPSIARLERGGYTSTSITTLSHIADTLGYSLKISLSPKKRSL